MPKEKIYCADVPFLMNLWGNNPSLNPALISAKSKTISANWHCKKCDYTWSSIISSRYKSGGKCPCCDSNKVIKKGINDVLTIVPDLKYYYDFDKNKDIDIYTQGLDSAVHVWRKCPDCGRSWQTAIKSCIKKTDGKYSVVKCPHFNTTKRKKEEVPFISEIPSLAKFFDSTKNVSSASEIKSNSTDTVFWICPNCCYTWCTSPLSQLKGTGKCACCELGIRPQKDINDLFTIIPEAKNYYDFEANGNFDIYSHPIRDTSIKLFWKCPTCNHRWSSSISSRIEGTRGNYKWRKCHQCYLHDKSRITPISSKSFLVKKWDYKKNNDKDVNLTSVHSYEQCFWHCKKCGYKWSESIKNMTIQKGSCPYCERETAIFPGKNDVLTLVPELTDFCNKNTNMDLLHTLKPASKKEFLWKCPKCSQEWTSSVEKRVRLNSNNEFCVVGCSKCGYKAYKQQPYSEQYPLLASMFNKKLNSISLDDIFGTEAHKTKYYWNCPDCEEIFPSLFSAMAAAIKEGHTGCPYCSHTLLRNGESFADIHPEYMDEYDPNNVIDAYTTFPNSKDQVNWICRKNPEHKWKASFALRHANGGNCPICNHSYVVSDKNSFSAVYPNHVNMWSNRNEKSPEDTFFDSSLWLWWKCPTCKQEYGSYIEDVVSEEESCPYCSDRLVLPGINSFAAKNKTLMNNEYDYLANYLIIDPDMVSEKSKIIVWWKCHHNNTHKYPMSFATKLMYQKRNREPCPYCKGLRRKKSHYVKYKEEDME